MTIPLRQQVAELRREIAMRESVYPRWVRDGRMKQQEADHRVAAMKAALETVQRVADGNQQTMF